MINVRTEPFAPADRAACLAIFDANTPGAFIGRERDEFSEFLDDPGGQYWVVRDPDALVVACGGADLLAGGRFGVMTWTMVLPNWQRQGLGSRLTRTALEYVAATPRAERVVLETSNLSAPFYERHGFQTTMVTPDHYAPGVHRHNMALELTDSVRQQLLGAPRHDQSRRHNAEKRNGQGEAP
ncbi:MAG: GNAT family N-acetyltransferase [Chloroflexota bacterium]|nr:GNAT family N-acetyltransferase [Chloroflexota bacterium]